MPLKELVDDRDSVSSDSREEDRVSGVEHRLDPNDDATLRGRPGREYSVWHFGQNEFFTNHMSMQLWWNVHSHCIIRTMSLRAKGCVQKWHAFASQRSSHALTWETSMRPSSERPLFLERRDFFNMLSRPMKLCVNNFKLQTLKFERLVLFKEFTTIQGVCLYGY